MSKIKYIYYFRGDLRSHVGIYKSWVDAAVSKGLDMQMVTFLDLKSYIKQRKLAEFYSGEGIKIYTNLSKYLGVFIESVYFFFLCLRHDEIVVHVRKKPTLMLDFVKKFFPKKLNYIIELEGDPVSEAEYLAANPYREGFYDHIVNAVRKKAPHYKKTFAKCDNILVVTERFRSLLHERYPEMNMNEKTHVLPTGVDSSLFFFDEELRKKTREKLGIRDRFTFIFAGKLVYSWQNIKRSLDIFNLVKKRNVFNNPFLLLLVLSQDHKIAKEFISKAGLEASDYMLIEVAHSEVNAYFNAADLGILLRDDHIMNEVACPGKVGEYLSSGLQVMITEKIGLYGEKVKEAEMGIVLSDFRDDEHVLAELIKSKEKYIEREKISDWAHREFSVQAYAEKYTEILNQCRSKK